MHIYIFFHILLREKIAAVGRGLLCTWNVLNVYNIMSALKRSTHKNTHTGVNAGRNLTLQMNKDTSLQVLNNSEAVLL